MKKIFLRMAGILFGIILFAFSLLWFFRGGGEVKVPNIRGKDTASALEILSKEGLNLKLAERRFDNQIPKDYVIFQDPRPGIKVKSGREIKVILSKGSRKVIIPQLKGKSLRFAGVTLRQCGLKMGRVAKAYSYLMKEDSVMAQSLEAGMEANRGEGISLLVSIGSYPVCFHMPDLIGESLEKALRIVESLGLRVINITYEPDPELGEGLVINQVPQAGFSVKEKCHISLTISVKSKARPLGRPRFSLLHYVVPEGLSPKRIRIVISDAQGEREMYNALFRPGKEIDEAIAITGKARAKIYVDGELEREIPLR